MNSLSIDPETVKLIQMAAPFLGQTGLALTDGFLRSVELLTSNAGQEWLKSLSRVANLGGRGGKSLPLHSASGPADINLNLPFILFLIFILLFLSSGSMNTSTVKKGLFHL